MLRFTYFCFLLAYRSGIGVAALFSAKARAWQNGRKLISKQLSRFLRDYPEGKRYWFHSASLGEFEQARPVIEALRQREPEAKIIVTFFSPSGYEVRQETELAHLVCYLPFDFPGSTHAFVRKLKPTAVFWVKYEFWYHILEAIYHAGVPCILFAANFRQDQLFFKGWKGRLHRKMLTFFSRILVQNESSKELLASIGIVSEVAYDTRFDRVVAIAAQDKVFENIRLFKGNQKLLIAGSTWEKDSALLANLINNHLLQGWKVVIAPHQVEKVWMDALIGQLKVKKVLMSRLHEGNVGDYDVVLVNMIGALATLYRYADAVYVGGGFDVSVHSVLEPAVYGVPIMFGPNYKKSAEAIELVARGGARVISSEEDVLVALRDIKWLDSGAGNAAFVQTHTGGTEAVLKAYYA
ncbi:MAG: glycosyltransferase N-terminal domain-containing protein [Chitinophagales bacterium]